MEDEKINYTFWVTFRDPAAVRKQTTIDVRVSKGKPSISLSEITMQMSVDVPVSYFKKPELSAKIELPERNSSTIDIPIDIDRISEVIQLETGHKVELELKQS